MLTLVDKLGETVPVAGTADAERALFGRNSSIDCWICRCSRLEDVAERKLECCLLQPSLGSRFTKLKLLKDESLVYFKEQPPMRIQETSGKI